MSQTKINAPVLSFVSSESTLIAGAVYDPKKMQLVVEFRATPTAQAKRFRYRTFPQHEWTAFLQAMSKGRHFQQAIRPHYVGEAV